MWKQMLVMACLITVGVLTTKSADAGVNILAGISTQASIPSTVLSTKDNVGVMVTGRYLKSFLPFVSVGQSVGYVRLSGKQTVGSVASDGVGLSIIPILTMVQLAPPTPGIKPYVNAGLGLYYLSTGSATFTSLLATAIPGASSTKFGFSAGGGVIFGFPGPIDFQVDVSYHNIQTDGSATSFVGIQAGLQIGLF
jgi:opacity protein-like surface antigen